MFQLINHTLRYQRHLNKMRVLQLIRLYLKHLQDFIDGESPLSALETNIEFTI